MSHSITSVGRTASLAALVCSLVVALALVPGAAVATGTADTVVGPDETIAEDLTVSTGDVVVRGTVEGDVTALSGSVRVPGEVTGDVTAAAGSVTVAGTVRDDVSAAAGSVDVADGATVDGDVSAAAGSVDVGAGARVGGSVSAGAGSAIVAEGATVAGDVSAGGGDAEVRGTVRGDVASGQSVVLASSAVVDGDVTYRETVDRADGAVVGGSVEQRDESVWHVGVGDVDLAPDLGVVGSLVPGAVPAPFGHLYWTVVALLTGAALLALFPAFSTEVAATAVDEPMRTGAAGFAALVVTPFVLFALLLTIVGIPVAFGGGALYVLALWTGLVYGEYLAGRQLLAAFDRSNRWAALALGVVAVSALSVLPLLGDLVAFVALLVGLGAVVLSARDRWNDDDAGDDPVGPTEPPNGQSAAA